MLRSGVKKADKFSGRLKVEELDTTSSESALSSEVEIPIQMFYVCFSPSGDYRGASLMRHGFSHVSIMERVPLGFIVHDPNKSALDTYILPEAPTQEFLEIFLQKRPDYTILEVTKEATNREQYPLRFGPQTCVSVVSYIMGIRLPWYCITPHGLYKRLLSGGYGILNVRRV